MFERFKRRSSELEDIDTGNYTPEEYEGCISELQLVNRWMGDAHALKQTLLKDVERKGYAPTFFSGLDAEARQWYAVRIGAYSDKQQATNAAANFTRQEKMKAVVRPLGSL